MREIGSIFPIGRQDDEPNSGSGMSFGPSIKLYSLCREALLALLQAIDAPPEKRPSSRLYMFHGHRSLYPAGMGRVLLFDP